MTKALVLADFALLAEAKRVADSCAAILSWPVTTQAELDWLATGLKDCTARLKFLVESEQGDTRPLLDDLETARAKYRDVKAAYTSIKSAINQRTVRYHQEQRAGEVAARAAALATQEQAHAAARVGNLPQASALQRVAFQHMSAAPPAMKAEGVHTRKEWRVEVTDPAKVPRGLCVPDPAAILARVREQLGKASEVSSSTFEQAATAWAADGVRVFVHETAIAK